MQRAKIEVLNKCIEAQVLTVINITDMVLYDLTIIYAYYNIYVCKLTDKVINVANCT